MAPRFSMSKRKESYVASYNQIKRENVSLRKELEEAYRRIRQLEASSTVAVVSDCDDSSVEVHSLGISITSSMTTAPTGSAQANDDRFQQKLKDVCETNRDNQYKDRHYQGQMYPSLQGVGGDRKRDVLASYVDSLLDEEESESGCSNDLNLLSLTMSDISESSMSESPNVVVGSLLSRKKAAKPQLSDSVSEYSSIYFTRTGSSDAEPRPMARTTSRAEI